MKNTALILLISSLIGLTAKSEVPGPMAPELINCTENITMTYYFDSAEEYITAAMEEVLGLEKSELCFSYIEDYATGSILDYEIEATSDGSTEKLNLSSLSLVKIRNYTTKITDPVTKNERTLISTTITLEDTREKEDTFDSVEPAQRLFITLSLNGTHAEKVATENSSFNIDVYEARLVGVNLNYLRAQDEVDDTEKEYVYGIHD